MNSITPIASLASTIDDLLEESSGPRRPEPAGEEAHREAFADIHHAAQTIQKRSQGLINLLLNAAQAVEGQKDARIALAAYQDGQARTLVEVKDNGPGITAEDIDKIFIPFFSTKEGGAGIGLSFSRQVMHLHRGSISVHSRPDEETVFTLRF